MLKDPIVCIPVTYFIGENGLPLEVIGGDLPVDDFVSRANKALEVIYVLQYIAILTQYKTALHVCKLYSKVRLDSVIVKL